MIKYSRSLPDPDFLGVTCRQLRKTKIGQFEAEELAVTVEKMSIISKGKIFTADQKNTPQKMKFSIKDFFSKCDKIRRNLFGYIYWRNP